MNAITVLQDAKRLLEDPRKWTQGYTARNAKNEACPSTSPQAVCWCAMGALNAVSKDKIGYPEAFNALNDAAISLYPDEVRRYADGWHPITVVNDQEGFEAVHNCFNAAINSIVEANRKEPEPMGRVIPMERK